jgi:phosphate transport system protein
MGDGGNGDGGRSRPVTRDADGLAVGGFDTPPRPDPVDQAVRRLFALVSEALARATAALLDRDGALGQGVVDGDQAIDRLTENVERSIWARIGRNPPDEGALRRDVGILLILPELERSADLAEHVAQRALTDLGAEMTPASRGIVQSMSDIALGMWNSAARAYDENAESGIAIDEADDGLDVLHERLTAEVAAGSMSPAVAAQVTLVSRFYERLGDHAVNLARRIETLSMP